MQNAFYYNPKARRKTCIINPCNSRRSLSGSGMLIGWSVLKVIASSSLIGRSASSLYSLMSWLFFGSSKIAGSAFFLVVRGWEEWHSTHPTLASSSQELKMSSWLTGSRMKSPRIQQVCASGDNRMRLHVLFIDVSEGNNLFRGMSETSLNILSFLFLPQKISRTSPKEYCWHSAKGRMRVARQIVIDCLVMTQRMSRDLAFGGIFQLLLFF